MNFLEPSFNPFQTDAVQSKVRHRLEVERSGKVVYGDPASVLKRKDNIRENHGRKRTFDEWQEYIEIELKNNLIPRHETMKMILEEMIEAESKLSDKQRA